MFTTHLGRRLRRSALLILTIAAVWLMATPALQAGGPPPGVPSGAMPWEWGKYLGYREQRPPSRPRPAKPETVTRSPAKYTIQVTRIPHQHTYDDPTAVFLVAHLPEDADFFVDEKPTKERGAMRTFVSPSLASGSNYSYTVRAVWYEDGQWVSQTHNFPVRAGDVHCIDLVQSRDQTIDQEVAANLGKLDAEDRKVAEEQKHCAVQEGVRLGAMGVPVKIMVQGEPVFLCCRGCEVAARRDPDKTLEKVQKLKAKKAGLPD
jgi:uncharacterized protein (TIGR03000 family)